ncbi:MAG: hypothetical protein GWN86_06860 [Desulfobacterales bacterium]|nr:hypothetical protein [Desulfobacterales bacterium]
MGFYDEYYQRENEYTLYCTVCGLSKEIPERLRQEKPAVYTIVHSDEPMEFFSPTRGIDDRHTLYVSDYNPYDRMRRPQQRGYYE